MDSGAQSSVAGKNFDKHMQLMNISPNGSISRIRTADGTIHDVDRTYDVPITYHSTTETLRILFTPVVSQDLILGMDFWEKFQIRPVIVGEVECEKSIPVSTEHELSVEHAKTLQVILKSMPFSREGALSKTHLIEHVIDTGNSPPIKQRHYIVSPYVQKEINVEIDRLLGLEVIEACEPSGWSSPIVVVRKTTGKIRLCLDARKLNDITIKDAYPQQQINRILGRLAGTTVLSSIDFSDAFLQVPLAESSQIKTAFAISGRGFFKYKRMAFGLCNSGATLCRLVDRVIGCDLEPYVFVYLDDIIIATDSYDRHFDILKKLAMRIKTAGLTISVTKSRFCMKSLRYLGYIVGEAGISPDPEKTASIKDYVQPKNVKDIRRLLGLAGWYRRFIPNFAIVTAPLTQLLKKNVTKFVWTKEAEEAMEVIKSILSTAPVLANPDYNKPFIIQTDASDIGMGGVLVQGEGDEERVVAYFSQKFNASQRKYQTTERECLAVILTVEKFRPYIEGVEFTVITDHASLLWLRNLKDPTGRLGRWALRLQPYQFTLKHRKGRFMVVADALSRAIESIENQHNSTDEWYNSIRLGVEKEPQKYPTFKIIEDKLFKSCPKNRTKLGQYQMWREVVPKGNRSEILCQNHDDPLSAHGGFAKTIDRIRRKYFWPQMDKEIRKYVRDCQVCKAVKPTNQTQRSPMGNFRAPSRPWEIIYVDFVGPLPRSRAGFTYLFVVVDGFSKFVHLHPMRDALTKTTISCLNDHIFRIYGTPRYLISDNGPQFIASAFKDFLNKNSVTSWYTSRYHPQANAAEAANKTVETAIRTYLRDELNHKDWDKYLPQIACAMNTSQHSSTLLSPYFALFGTQMCTSGQDYDNSETPDDNHSDKMTEIRKIIRSNLLKNYESSKRRYDLRSRPISYEVGDEIWVKNRILSNAVKGITAKLAPEYRKCVVKKKIGTNSYEVANMMGKSMGIFNTDCLKK